MRTSRALVVYCHPDPDSFVAAARDRLVAGLAESGHEIRLVDLYADDFEPALTAPERRTHREPGVLPDLEGYADDLRWADVLVLAYPTWWSGQPAMLKGWIDRVWVAGVAWDVDPRTDRLAPRLRNIKRLAVVTTHGSPKLVNALQGEGGKRVAMRAIRSMCSRFVRTSWCAMYGLDRSTEADRAAFLDRIERTFARF